MLLVVFAAVLLIAVLLSSLARRTILSTAVMFLIAGIAFGPQAAGILTEPRAAAVNALAELALFAVLFTDGMRVGWPDLRGAWRLPGRALAWGLPLTLGVTAALGRYLVGLDWPQALLLGAVLAPTDPVFASAIVGNEKVPDRLRRLLNVESGLNDGLALPFVLIFLAVSGGARHLHPGRLTVELLAGVVIGVAVPWLALLPGKRHVLPALAPSRRYRPLYGFAIGLLVLGLSRAVHANLFLAAFSAGVTTATVGPQQREAFERFGELIVELLKLAALLVFGALLTIGFLAEIRWSGWVFALLALLVARPLALAVSFVGARLTTREKFIAMWFGPKGFASVVYGLLVRESGIPGSSLVFHLVAVSVGLSIIAHSSTDTLIARMFDPSRTPTWYERYPSAWYERYRKRRIRGRARRRRPARRRRHGGR